MPCRRNVGSGSLTTGYSAESTSLLAIVEGRGHARGEVGLASLDLHVGKLIICQFSDSQNYTRVISKLNIFHPAEILMPSTVCDVPNQLSRLYLQIQAEFPLVTLVPLQRRVFNEVVGMQKLEQISLKESESVLYTVAQKYYGLAAVAALLKYIELVRNIIFPPKAVKVEFQSSEKTVMIDRSTSQHLELLQNNLVSNSAHSLFGVVNNCKTPGGSRCLRTNILQPLCDLELITRRLDCIQELRNNPVMLYDLMNVLSQLHQDLEHVLATLTHIPKVDSQRVTEQRINYTIFLKQSLAVLPAFVQVLANSNHHYFHSVRQDFASPTFDAILQRIKRVINEDARVTKSATAMRMQRTFAVNAELNPLLDIARKAMCEIQDDTNKYVVDLAKEHQMNLRLMENNTRGFYVQFIIPGRRTDLPPLPDTFLHVVKKKNLVTFTTEPLLLAEQRINKILEEIHNISTVIVSELVTHIRQDIGCLYKVSDAISELDILCSLTSYALNSDLITRPDFSSTYTAISMGRHPILDAISTVSPVPNSLFMSTDTNVAIITGPNMSGKTTLLKQIATLQVLAQIGSFVPADAATFKMVNRIFSRVGNGDKIEDSASSFALEMREMNYILGNMNDQSLVIVDELGRSTSLEEGTSISWAMIEELMAHKGLILFATHYMFLTKMESLYMNILNYKLDTGETMLEENETDNGSIEVIPSVDNFARCVSLARLDYRHILKRGVTDIEHYGLKLAKNSCFPRRVVERAMILAKDIMNSRTRPITLASSEDLMECQSEKTNSPKKRAAYLLGVHLCLLAGCGADKKLTKLELHNYLQNLQDEAIVAFF